jgi:hypothetical protein
LIINHGFRSADRHFNQPAEFEESLFDLRVVRQTDRTITAVLALL